MADRTMIELTRDVLAEIAPAELDDLDQIVRAMSQGSKPPRARSEPTASGWLDASEALNAMVWAVGTDVCKELILYGVKSLGSKARSRFRLRRSPAVKPETVPPAISDADAAAVVAIASALAVERGAPADIAASVADALGRKWPRLP